MIVARLSQFINVAIDRDLDCCDGSDEYASGAQCPVTCAALMKTFQADKAVEIASMEAGEADRKVLVADAAAAYAADQDKRAALASSVASLRVMLEQQEARKAHEEELERADRVSRLREKQATLLQQLGLADLSHEQLSLIVLELSKHLDSPDELLALIARERASVSAAQATPLPPSPIEEQEAAFRVRDEARQRETERIQALLDERRAARDAAAAATSDDVPGVGGSESTTSDSESSSSESTGDSDLVLPEIEERPAKLLFQELHAHNDYERPEAAEARATLADTTQSLGTHETDLRVLDAKLAKAYGPDRVLYALRDQCYETQSGEYTYSVCVFGDAKQSNTRLGAMQDINDDDALTTLTFSGGDKCWNGPERSIQVALECGALPVELYAVDEPATCVYTAKLRTPLACDQRNRDRVLSPASGEAPVAPHHVEVEVSATL